MIDDATDDDEEIGRWGAPSDDDPTPTGGGERGARSLSPPN